MNSSRGRRGSSLVDGSLALVLLLLVALAIVDTGRYLYGENLLPYLAREGVRYALLRPEAEAEDIARHVRGMAAGLPAKEIAVELTRENAAITVRAAWTFHPATGVLFHQAIAVAGQSRLPVRPGPVPQQERRGGGLGGI